MQLLAVAVWLIWAAFLLCLFAEAGSLASAIPLSGENRSAPILLSLRGSFLKQGPPSQ